MDVVLVHGSYHGAWCWDLLRPELERLGHRALAVDLPISDPDLAASAYADVVVEAMADMADPVVVGHSMAGLVIPLVAERRAVHSLVFLAAMLPVLGRSANDQRKNEAIDAPIRFATAEWTLVGDDVWMVGPNTATEAFFHDATAEVASWASARLRPQCYRVMSEVTPLVAWPAVEQSYVVCRDDHAVNPDWGRTAALDRLGIDAIEIDGGHSPFLTRPAELAALLDRLIDRPTT
jgi:pimeloyl-ACP methyl ester carboxylesterase